MSKYHVVVQLCDYVVNQNLQVEMILNSLAIVLPVGFSQNQRQGQQQKETVMRKLIKMATVVASVGAMLSFAGCGAKAPDAVALDVLKTLQDGKATPEYLAKNCTEKSVQLFSMFGAMVTENLKGATLTIVDTKIDGDTAIVTIKQDGGKEPGTEEYDLVKVNGVWKLDIDKEKQASRKAKAEEDAKFVKGGKESSDAEAVLEKCIDLAKKGVFNKDSAKKYFCCSDDDLNELLQVFEVFDYKSDSGYKNASKEEQAKADKELGRMGVTSSSFNAGGGYAVVGIGNKDKPDMELGKFKVVKKNGEWKIAGVYVEGLE